jgi:hypothetical protein
MVRKREFRKWFTMGYWLVLASMRKLSDTESLTITIGTI